MCVLSLSVRVGVYATRRVQPLARPINAKSADFALDEHVASREASWEIDSKAPGSIRLHH